MSVNLGGFGATSNGSERPSFIKPGDRRGLENTEEQPRVWSGPSASVMLSLALAQPGAKRRVNGVKFQCDQCRQEGHDKSKDNAIVFLDGRFSCAVGGAAHRAAIAAQLNIPQQRILVDQTPVPTRIEMKERTPSSTVGLEVKELEPLPTGPISVYIPGEHQ